MQHGFLTRSKPENKMKNYSATARKLRALTVAVTGLATTIGLTCAIAYTEGTGYYVMYSLPSGYLVRTETRDDERQALHAFEQALFICTLSKN